MNSTLKQDTVIAMAVTFTGGAIDSFSYNYFNHTLPLTQSGNMVLLTTDIVNKDWSGISTKLSSLFAFILGIIVARFFHKKFSSMTWKLHMLIYFLISSLWTYLLMDHVGKPIAIFPLSFGLALTVTAFDKVGNHNYNNSFTTGNIKKMILNWADFIFMKEPQNKESAIFFTKIVLSFITGALFSAVAQTILLDNALFLLALFIPAIIIALFMTPSQ